MTGAPHTAHVHTVTLRIVLEGMTTPPGGLRPAGVCVAALEFILCSWYLMTGTHTVTSTPSHLHRSPKA
jgi:hypothetical protein